MAVWGTKAEKQFGIATLWVLPLILFLGLGAAACGGGGSSSNTPAPGPAPAGLWVPNFFAANVVAFDGQARQQSGAPAPAVTNTSALIDQPEEVLFDTNGNLWLTSCSDPVLGAGTITQFTSAQLKNLQTNPGPTPNVILSDDGSSSIFGCPYGEAFESDGSLWAANRFSADLINFTPSQLSVGGVQFPNTKITSSSFGEPEGIQFDAAGTLWVADILQSQIFGFKAATIAAVKGTNADLTPDIINSSAGINGPADVLVVQSGNQWVSNCKGDTVVEFAASDVAASGSPTPVVVLSPTSVSTPSGNSPSLDCPQGLAFDKSGNLWVSNTLSDNSGSIVEFTPSQLTASGSPVPNIFLDSNPARTNLNQPALFTFGPSIR